jgi:cobalamin synthase
MAKMADRNLLTIGAIFVIIVISILLYFPAKLYGGYYILPAIIGLFGAWLMVLSFMQHSNPEKYGRGAFSYFGWGLLLIAVGGGWFLDGYGYGIYALALILLVLGGLAIAAAFRRK